MPSLIQLLIKLPDRQALDDILRDVEPFSRVAQRPGVVAYLIEDGVLTQILPDEQK